MDNWRESSKNRQAFKKILSKTPLLSALYIVQAEQAPSTQAPSPTPLDIYRAYESVLLGWLRRFRLSPPDAEDIMQEVWLGICDRSVPMPTSVQEARFALLKVAKRMAIRMRRREQRQRLRHVPDPDQYAEDVDVEAHAMYALGVFEALERLPSPHREIALEHCVLGTPIKEMAERARISESTMGKRVWRALAELEKLRREDQKLEEKRDRSRQSGLLIAPCPLDLDPETRAAFCAIWDVEGRLPQFGGPTPPPPSPPPALPRFGAASRSASDMVSYTFAGGAPSNWRISRRLSWAAGSKGGSAYCSLPRR
jgi:RNA polymerase sigma factor (sigma-70 family)